jgi:tetratricopeptide (TPR) repeat protein
MASIISAYAYDIFISYRQKDNKGDKWVSEFVETLKTELESTFKEEISVYFDINPHDGLLEMHDVDASLKEKLKCLVFIPIISRTYCDPKSFAWEYEFKAFIEGASTDRFGLKINLPKGNVSSRVLPVRIHELDKNDLALCESLLGGAVRGVDFVFKSPGVNRPLRAIEDNPHDNLNKTYYRDQINKVANAIKEILESLRDVESEIMDEFMPEKEIRTTFIKENNPVANIRRVIFNLKTNKRSLVFLMIFLFLVVVCAIYELTRHPATDNTLALIPLVNENNDSTLNENGDVFLDLVWEKLQRVREITLTSRISSLKYRNTKKPISIMGRELKANYLVAGSIGREANKTVIRIELIKAKADKPLWFHKYALEKNQVIKYSNEIIRDITTELNISLSAEEIVKIERSPTKNYEAYQNFFDANGISGDAWLYYNMGNKLLDSTSFRSAITTYDKAIKNDTLFALAYAKRAIARSWGFATRELDSTNIEKCREDIDKALNIDKELIESQIAQGFYFYYCKGDYYNALKYFEIAADRDPGNYQPMFYMAMVYRKMGEWEKSKGLINKVIKLNPQEALYLTNIGFSFDYQRNYDSALIYHQKAIDMLPGWPNPYKNKIQTYILKNGNTVDARKVLDSATAKTEDKYFEMKIMLYIYERKYVEALQLAQEWIHEDPKDPVKKYIYLARISGLQSNPLNEGKYYDSSLIFLNKEVVRDPTNAEIHSFIGIAAAAKGYKEKAIVEGKIAVDLTVNNKLEEIEMKISLAQIYLMTGEFNTAIKNLENLLTGPSLLSVNLLRLDPIWKPLANNSDFQTMIKKYSKIQKL